MCIIAAKPTGIDLPTKDIFDSCFTSNKDGIGFAYNLPGERPTISKGMFTVKSLMENIDDHGITKEHNLVVHFRFGTHGKKDAGNCHPFPISTSFKDMRVLDCECDCAVSHNGIFGSMPRSDKYSDTMKFVGGILASPDLINNLNTPSIKELIRGYCGTSSKLSFLTKDGITNIGEWELEEGISYSNRQFKSFCNRTSYTPPDEGTEYCYQHQKWDKCHKNHKNHDLEWCYNHKKYDHCRWCTDHQERDTCAYDNKNTRPIVIPKKIYKGTTLELKIPCEWCRSVEKVKYNDAQDSYLCVECTKALTEYVPQLGYKGRGAHYYDD